MSPNWRCTSNQGKRFENFFTWVSPQRFWQFSMSRVVHDTLIFCNSASDPACALAGISHCWESSSLFGTSLCGKAHFCQSWTFFLEVKRLTLSLSSFHSYLMLSHDFCVWLFFFFFFLKGHDFIFKQTLVLRADFQ